MYWYKNRDLLPYEIVIVTKYGPRELVNDWFYPVLPGFVGNLQEDQIYADINKIPLEMKKKY